jgi:hypothetical protein
MATFPENTPRFVKIQIERAGVLDERILHKKAEQYFAVSQKVGNIDKRDWKARSMYWGPLLSLIPFIIEWWAERDQVRRVLSTDNFPEIKEMTREFAARGLKGQMQNVVELIEWYPDLGPWREIVDVSLKMMETAERVQSILVERESIEERELIKCLSMGGRIPSETLKAMAKYEMILRLKNENGWIISKLEKS